MVAGTVPVWSVVFRVVPEVSEFVDAVSFSRERLDFFPDLVQADLLGRRVRRGLVNCTRQWGKSTVTAAKAVHQAYFFPNSLTLMVSPTARQSAEFLRKAAVFVGRLGIRARGDGDNENSLLFPNGSRLVALPGSEATVRGFSKVSLLLIDEASRVSDEMYRAVRPMLAVGDGDLLIMSTPNGRRGSFGRNGRMAARVGSGSACRRRSAHGFQRRFWRRSGGRWATGGSGRNICVNFWKWKGLYLRRR
jgi:hypothetical protein